jgi:hypothetical protein
MPSSVVGGLALRKTARNCRPCVTSLTQAPLARTNSPAVIVAAWPTTVIRSRCPRAFTRSTQNPVSALWNVTRSTTPASTSLAAASAVLACIPLPYPGFMTYGNGWWTGPGAGAGPVPARYLRHGNWFRHASDRIGFDMCGTVEPCFAGLKAAAFGVEAIAASAEPF